jgi:hypothetical protein
MQGHCMVATLLGSWNWTTPKMQQITSKAASSTDFEKSCTISTNQSSNGDDCHHHKEAVTNKKTLKST